MNLDTRILTLLADHPQGLRIIAITGLLGEPWPATAQVQAELLAMRDRAQVVSEDGVYRALVSAPKPPAVTYTKPGNRAGHGDRTASVLELLSHGPAHCGEVAAHCGITERHAHAQLSNMVKIGLVARLGNESGRVRFVATEVAVCG